MNAEPSPAAGLGRAPPRVARRWHLLWASLAALVLWHAWFSQFNHDEIEHLHASWLVAHGQTPFADFLEQHHPTLWYLVAPATRWFGSVRGLVFAVRLLDLGLLLAVLAAFVRILRRVYPGARARWPALLLVASFIFTRSMMELRPDPLMNALLYAGLLAWVAFLQDGGARRALVAGLLFGAAIAVLQKAAVATALAAAATVLLAVLRRPDREARRRLLAGAAVLLAGAAVPVAALFALVAARGFWRDFWFWNYDFNRFFYLQASLGAHFSPLLSLGVNVAVDPVLWGAGGAGMVLCARDLWRRPDADPRGDARLGLLVVAAGYVPYLGLNRFPLDQYYVVPLPLLALFSAEVFERLRDGRAAAWLRGSAAFMAVVLAAILVLYPGNRPQRVVQDLVLARTAPDQAVFVPPSYNPVFRPHSGYFWYNGSLIGGAYAAYCAAHPGCRGRPLALDEALWNRAPPAFVFLDQPDYYPYHWRERAPGYERTSLPGLWRASRALLGRAARRR